MAIREKKVIHGTICYALYMDEQDDIKNMISIFIRTYKRYDFIGTVPTEYWQDDLWLAARINNYRNENSSDFRRIR